MKLNLIKSVFLFLLVSIFLAFNTNAQQQFKWTTARGFDISLFISEEDFRDLKETGADIIRVSFPTLPFMELEEPFSINKSSFEHLDKILDLCEKYNIRAVIDPHRFPGTRHQWTMLANDPFWTDFKWHQKAILIWAKIANHCKNRGNVIAGYDLLNEPALPPNPKANTPSDLNLLYRKLVTAVRKYDRRHTIILAAPRTNTEAEENSSYVAGLKLLEAPFDDNLCYEIHMYSPMEFSHQGVWEESEPVKYPGTISGSQWDINKLRSFLKPAKDFAEKYNVSIFVGEFSCPRWTGESGNSYIGDLITVFEEYDFSWAYHAFRESHIWDAEKNNFDRNDSENRKLITPRKKLLLKAFQKNN